MVFERKLMKNPKCILKRDPAMIDVVNSEVFMSGSETSAYFLYLLVAEVPSVKQVWMLNYPIYEYNQVFYYTGRNANNDQLIAKR